MMKNHFQNIIFIYIIRPIVSLPKDHRNVPRHIHSLAPNGVFKVIMFRQKSCGLRNESAYHCWVDVRFVIELKKAISQQ